MKISDDKLKHMRAVAQFMYDNADKFGLFRNRMFMLGYVHDIGVMVNGYGHHEKSGYEFLNEMGYKDAYLVRCHGLTPDEYVETHERCKNYSGIPPELILLWYADMYCDSKGNIVGFDKRLKDIGDRHGYDSVAYRKSYEIVDWLRKYQKLD